MRRLNRKHGIYIKQYKDYTYTVERLNNRVNRLERQVKILENRVNRLASNDSQFYNSEFDDNNNMYML